MDSDRELITALRRSEELLEHLLDVRTHSAEHMVRLDGAVASLQKETSEILAMLRGRQGLEVRLSLAEERLSRVELSQSETTKGKWLLIAVLTTGILGVVTAVLKIMSH